MILPFKSFFIRSFKAVKYKLNKNSTNKTFNNFTLDTLFTIMCKGVVYIVAL